MKKIVCLLVIILCLSACADNKPLDDNKVDVPSHSDLSITVPSGAPALAFYNEINNNEFNTADAKSILPELKGKGGSDIIVIDTVNGIKVLNGGANYKLAAVITFGNFFIASTGHDDDQIMNDGDYIVVFSQNATPDLVFHYLYGDSLDSNLHYVNAVSDASACLIKGINIADEQRNVDELPYVDYVMIAQPALTAAMSQNDSVSIYANVQELYKQKSDGLSMIQAAVFVSNELTHEQAQQYLNSLQDNITLLLTNPSLFEEACSQNELDDVYVKDLFGVANVKIAQKVLSNNSIGLGFKKAIDIKDDIDSFIEIFGVGKTNEEIYFQ